MGGGAADERYVTLGGCTVQRYKGVGVVKFSGKKRYVTLEWPLNNVVRPIEVNKSSDIFLSRSIPARFS